MIANGQEKSALCITGHRFVVFRVSFFMQQGKDNYFSYFRETGKQRVTFKIGN